MIHRRTHKLNPITAVAFAIGAMVGGGVFALSGLALQQAGPAALISFIIAGFVVFLSALSFAVIASKVTSKYPGYSYVGNVLGSPVWGFLTSWCFYLAGIIGVAFVLNAFGTYAHQFVSTQMSPVGWALAGAVLLTLINLGSISAIGKVETWLVGGKLAILCLLAVFGIFHFQPSDVQPFMSHGSMQMLATSASLFIAFLGFNVITNMSGDIENPQKTVPKAIMWSMVIVALVYAGVVIALLSVHIHDYSEASVGIAAQQLLGPIGGGLIIIGALISTLSSANANILGSSEIMVRLAASKQIPTILGHMHHGHPYVSVMAGAVVYVLLIVSGQAQIVIDLANVTAMSALIIVNAAAAKALFTPSHTGLRLPLGGIIPIIAAVAVLIQFAFMPLTNVLVGLILAGSGIVVYMLRKRFHLPRLHLRLTRIIANLDGPLSRSLRD